MCVFCLKYKYQLFSGNTQLLNLFDQKKKERKNSLDCNYAKLEKFNLFIKFFDKIELLNI